MHSRLIARQHFISNGCLNRLRDANGETPEMGAKKQEEKMTSLRLLAALRDLGGKVFNSGRAELAKIAKNSIKSSLCRCGYGFRKDFLVDIGIDLDFAELHRTRILPALLVLPMKRQIKPFDALPV